MATQIITTKTTTGTEILDQLRRESPSTRYELRKDGKEIAAWDQGRNAWMAIVGMGHDVGSRELHWTSARNLMQYHDGQISTDQKGYPDLSTDHG